MAAERGTAYRQLLDSTQRSVDALGLTGFPTTIIVRADGTIEQSIRRALTRVRDLDVSTRWTDAELFGRTPAEPMPNDPSWAGGVVFADHQRVEAIASDIFGPGDDRSFLTPSGSVGAVWDPTEGWNLALSVAYTNRAPTYQELFADGPHVATGIYEIGNRDLGVESGLGIDVTLRRTLGWITGSVTGFYDRFDDFIANRFGRHYS